MSSVVLIKSPKNAGIDVSLVENITNKVLQKMKLNDVEVSIWFVGRKRAKDLNIKYRNKSYIPQVLGFPLSRERDGDGMMRLGDIVICTQKLKYEAVFQNKTVKTIMEEWLLHGVENLLIQ
jgi:rRNA maturation RNase YbeY